MRQHVNLCSQLDRVVEPPFSARQQVLLTAAVAFLMICIAALMWRANDELSTELAQLQTQQQQLAATLDGLRAEKAKRERETNVKDELTLLTEDIYFRRQLLASIDPSDSGGQTFAEYLQGLARQHVDGLWFTDIHLLEGGQQLSLVGSTREPEYLPRYLQKLNAEKVFAGHQFRVFRMKAVDDGQDLLDFEVRAFEEELYR